MTTTLIASYLGQGLVANRPTAPAVNSGVIAFYFATDTGALYVYVAGAWQQIH